MAKPMGPADQGVRAVVQHSEAVPNLVWVSPSSPLWLEWARRKFRVSQVTVVEQVAAATSAATPLRQLPRASILAAAQA